MTKFGRLIAPVAVLALAFGTFAVLQASRPEPEKNEQGPRPTSVYVAPVLEQAASLEVIAQGDVRAAKEIDLSSQVSGRITAASAEFIEGGRIEPNLPFLFIEDTDYQLALSEAHASLANAELAVEQALADQDVAKKQLRNDPTASDLALKKPQVTQARAQLEAARANLKQAEINLQRTKISLPFAGRIASTQVHVGQFISTGTVLGKAFSTDTVQVRLPLNNSQLATLGLPIGFAAIDGTGPSVEFSAEVAGQKHHWQGELVRLDASVDPTTRRLFALAELHDPYDRGASQHGMPMAVGLFVEARIQGQQLAKALSVPADAVRAGDIVYVVNDEGLLDIRRVEIAYRSGNRAIIASGLAADENVVTSAIRNPVRGMALTTIDRGAE